MTCEKTQQWMQGLLDGESSGWRTARVERHILRCESCAQALTEMRRVKKAVVEARPEILLALEAETGDGDFFWSQVRRHLQTPAPVSGRSVVESEWSWGFGRAGFVVAISTGVVLLLAGFIFFENRQMETDLAQQPTAVTNIATYAENTDQFTYVSSDTGNTFTWIHGLPTEDED